MVALSGVAFFFFLLIISECKFFRIKRLGLLVNMLKRSMRLVPCPCACNKSLNILDIQIGVAGQIGDFQASIFVNQHMNDLVTAILKKFYCLNSQVHDYETRNSDDIAIESTGTVRSAFTVRYMGPLIWNKLPVSIRMAEHLLSFKRK